QRADRQPTPGRLSQVAVLRTELHRGGDDGSRQPAQGRAAARHAGLRRFRHRDGCDGEGAREGPLSHGRAVHRRRCGRRLHAALGHDVQTRARASRIHRLYQPPRCATRIPARRGQGQGARRGLNCQTRGPDGAWPKSGLRSRLMILALRILYFEDLSVGMTETLSKTIAASDVVGFAQLTGDRNPIHLSEHFAAKTQFGKRIAHGLYTASLISAVLGTRLPGPGAVYISQTLNFRAPVKIGDQVDVTVTVAELIPERQRARLACSCKVGDEIVLDGEALVKVPSAAKSKRPLPRI